MIPTFASSILANPVLFLYFRLLLRLPTSGMLIKGPSQGSVGLPICQVAEKVTEEKFSSCKPMMVWLNILHSSCRHKMSKWLAECLNGCTLLTTYKGKANDNKLIHERKPEHEMRES